MMSAGLAHSEPVGQDSSDVQRDKLSSTCFMFNKNKYLHRNPMDTLKRTTGPTMASCIILAAFIHLVGIECVVPCDIHTC